MKATRSTAPVASQPSPGRRLLPSAFLLLPFPLLAAPVPPNPELKEIAPPVALDVGDERGRARRDIHAGRRRGETIAIDFDGTATAS